MFTLLQIVQKVWLQEEYIIQLYFDISNFDRV